MLYPLSLFQKCSFAYALNSYVNWTGCIYINDCDREKYIPIYLIVGGCTAITVELLPLLGTLLAFCIVLIRSESAAYTSRALVIVSYIVTFFVWIFACGWFIAGELFLRSPSISFVTSLTTGTVLHSTVYTHNCYSQINLWCHWWILQLKEVLQRYPAQLHLLDLQHWKASLLSSLLRSIRKNLSIQFKSWPGMPWDRTVEKITLVRWTATPKFMKVDRQVAAPGWVICHWSVT